ncbi:hypothetical protein VI03_08860 [Burkholderia vietnamiensis]|nr:hypothetical protein VI03_08860 [Burkholderia vietnamiensis]
MQPHTIQNARQPMSADRSLRHDSHGLMRAIIDHGEVLDHSAFRGSVEHEIHGPDLVGRRRSSQRLALRYRHLLAFAPAYLQFLFRIQPLDPLVIHPLA